jgi:hypothetical protein
MPALTVVAGAVTRRTVGDLADHGADTPLQVLIVEGEQRRWNELARRSREP